MDWNDRDDAFDLQMPDTWDDTSFAGQERDLADLLDDTTLEALTYAYELVTDADGAEFTQATYTIYTLMMMHDEAFLAMTGAAGTGPIDPRWAHRMALRNTIRDDANDGSGMYFDIRLRQRLQEGG